MDDDNNWQKCVQSGLKGLQKQNWLALRFDQHDDVESEDVDDEYQEAFVQVFDGLWSHAQTLRYMEACDMNSTLNTSRTLDWLDPRTSGFIALTDAAYHGSLGALAQLVEVWNRWISDDDAPLPEAERQKLYHAGSILLARVAKAATRLFPRFKLSNRLFCEMIQCPTEIRFKMLENTLNLIGMHLLDVPARQNLGTLLAFGMVSIGQLLRVHIVRSPCPCDPMFPDEQEFKQHARAIGIACEDDKCACVGSCDSQKQAAWLPLVFQRAWTPLYNPMNHLMLYHNPFCAEDVVLWKPYSAEDAKNWIMEFAEPSLKLALTLASSEDNWWKYIPENWLRTCYGTRELGPVNIDVKFGPIKLNSERYDDADVEDQSIEKLVGRRFDEHPLHAFKMKCRGNHSREFANEVHAQRLESLASRIAPAMKHPKEIGGIVGSYLTVASLLPPRTALQGTM